MEIFEIKKPRVERQASTASSHSGRNSKMGYIFTMAGIILFTSTLLVVLHFTKEYTQMTEAISSLNINGAEKLERRTCEVPFCNTKDCVFVAATLQEYMNIDADPCTDFYEYACGGYARSKAVPYASDSYSPIKEAQEELLIDIRKMMEKNPLSENEGLAVNKMRRFYKSCMNNSLRDDFENKTISFWFTDNEIVPETYVLGQAINFEQSTQWTKLVSKLEEYEIHTLFKPRFIAADNSAPEKMEIDCLVPFLNPEAYRNTSDDELTFQLMMYKESMDAVLELLHFDRDSRRQFIEDVMSIETNIAMTVAAEDAVSYQYLSQENKQQLRSIWLGVVGNAVEEIDVVSTCKYDMHGILNILNHAPNKNVVKYVVWRMMMELMQYMGTEFRSLHVHYMTKLPSLDYAFESKWKECTDIVRSEFSLVALKDLLDNGYLKKDIVDVMNADFIEMKRDIALVFSTIEGIDEKVATKFLDKLKGMKLETGYTELINQDGNLDSFYSEVDVSDNYFLNIIDLKRFKTRKYLTRLWYGSSAEANNELSLEQNPLGSNTGYDYLTNTVRVDLGLFRPPLIWHSNDIPNYLTYAYSSILSREMSRAFDFTGSSYDADGKRFEKIFWPTSMEQRYDNVLACIKDQITRLNTKGVTEVNDTRLLNNFVADMGAFFVPYEGLQTHLKSHMQEKPLPAVHLNKKQTFYVQTAQMFCELRSKPASNPASKFLLPPKSRVNGAVLNMEDFGNVFNCPVGAPMNLQNKCNFFH